MYQLKRCFFELMQTMRTQSSWEKRSKYFNHRVYLSELEPLNSKNSFNALGLARNALPRRKNILVSSTKSSQLSSSLSYLVPEMEFVSVRAVHNCATMKSLSRTLFPLSGPFYQLGIPPLRLSRSPPVCGNASVVVHARKRNSYARPMSKQKNDTQIGEDEEEFDYDEAVSEYDEGEEIEDEEEFEYDEEVGEEEEEEEERGKNNYLDEGIILVDDDDEDDFDFDFEDKVVDVSRKTKAGDGGDGGGIALGSKQWEKEALSIAEELSEKSFDGDLKIYAFKTSPKLIVYIRIEKLSSKYGSPGINDIEAFSRAYREKLEEAVTEGRMPDNVSFEVSSPGVERVLRIPEDLERFKDRPMYVNYITDDGPALSPPIECDGIFSLLSYDLELGQCVWAIADVKANRKGKGRPLNKKQKELRVTTPFESLRIVRLHSDC